MASRNDHTTRVSRVGRQHLAADGQRGMCGRDTCQRQRLTFTPDVYVDFMGGFVIRMDKKIRSAFLQTHPTTAVLLRFTDQKTILPADGINPSKGRFARRPPGIADTAHGAHTFCWGRKSGGQKGRAMRESCFLSSGQPPRRSGQEDGACHSCPPGGIPITPSQPT